MPRVGGKKRASRKKVVFKGHGAYSMTNLGPYGKAGKNIGKYIGSSFGGSLGGKAGSLAGRFLGHQIGKTFFGSGAYGQTGSDIMTPDIPKFGNNTYDDSVVISHREYLGDVITSGTANTFKIEKFSLNPASVETFPWLSQLAQPNFQQYKFDGCIFEFRSFSADALNSTNTALGSLFACINYDSNDDDFSSRSEVENSDWSKSCKPSDNVLIPVECATRQTALGGGLLYVINGNNIPAGADPKTYLLGNLFIGTTGFQGTNINIGSLYVSYKVRLYKPLMTKPNSAALMYTRLRANVDASNLFGNIDIQNTLNCDSFGVRFPTSNSIAIKTKRLRVGTRFEITVDWTGGSTVGLAYPGIPSVNAGAQLFTFYQAYTNGLEPTPRSATITDTACGLRMSIQVTDVSADEIIFTYPTLGAVLPTTCLCLIKIVELCGIPLNQIGDVVY